MFVKNTDYHSSAYNRNFNNFEFNDVCQYVPDFQEDLATCESFYEGILKDGIYASTLKYN